MYLPSKDGNRRERTYGQEVETLCHRVQRNFLCGTCVMRWPLLELVVNLKELKEWRLSLRPKHGDAVLVVLIVRYLWTAFSLSYLS